MPYSNIPESLWGKMDKCVAEVQAQGHDKESAIAICFTSIVNREEERMNPLQQLWEMVKRAFADAGMEIERSVVDVENWDGAASNYSSTENYCNACLINLNDGSADTWTQDMCKLPVVKPGGSAYVRQALHAAAQRISQISKPNGVATDKWDAAKKKAAKELVAAYKQADEVAPDVCYEMAGMQVPKRSVAAPETVQRTAPLQYLHHEICDQIDQLNQAAWQVDMMGMATIDWEKYFGLFDIYYDAGELFAVVTQAGKLYRIPVTVTPGDPNNAEGDTADTVTLGAPVEIPLTGRAMPSNFRVIRTTAPDGTVKYGWFAIACSSVLNRVNEIDSRALFDSFVEYAERTNEYPVLSFYHESEVIRWGQATGLARDGDLYIAWGDWFDTPQARLAAETFDTSKENWGTSIGYRSTKPPEWLELAGGVRIPVFTAGVNPEISIVLEREAAAYHTAFGTQEVKRMTKTDLAYQRLLERFGAQYADQFLDEVNTGQRAITEANPIRRVAADGTGTTPAPETTPAPAAPSTPVAREIVLDEETLNAIAEVLAGKLPFAGLQTEVATQTAALNALAPRVETLEIATRAAQTRIEERLAGLEQDEATKRARWQQDLPARPTTTLVLKPRDARAEQGANGAKPEAMPRGKPLY